MLLVRGLPGWVVTGGWVELLSSPEGHWETLQQCNSLFSTVSESGKTLGIANQPAMSEKGAWQSTCGNDDTRGNKASGTKPQLREQWGRDW